MITIITIIVMLITSYISLIYIYKNSNKNKDSQKGRFYKSQANSKLVDMQSLVRSPLMEPWVRDAEVGGPPYLPLDCLESDNEMLSRSCQSITEKSINVQGDYILARRTWKSE